jgi:hypothetical protein
MRRPLFTPARYLVLISVRGWIEPRAIVRLERLIQMNNLMTSSYLVLFLSYGRRHGHAFDIFSTLWGQVSGSNQQLSPQGKIFKVLRKINVRISVVTYWLMTTCTLWPSCSNLGPYFVYSDWGFSTFSSEPPRKYRDSTLKTPEATNMLNQESRSPEEHQYEVEVFDIHLTATFIVCFKY